MLYLRIGITSDRNYQPIHLKRFCAALYPRIGSALDLACTNPSGAMTFIQCRTLCPCMTLMTLSLRQCYVMELPQSKAALWTRRLRRSYLLP